MEIIDTLLNGLDPTALVPELDSLTFWLQTLLRVAVTVGPITLLVMGIVYVLAPPNEATHKAGFRTYFGMGSIQAWRFSQLVGGAAIALLGLVLTIISQIHAAGYDTMSLIEAAMAAIEHLKGQVISTAILYVLLFLAMAILFKRSGDCRFGWKLPFFSRVIPMPQENTPAQEDIPAEEEEEYVQEEFAPEFYQDEPSVPLRVEDIVIEGITDEESVF